LTLLGFLNDDYDGGDLYLCNQKINTKTGDILIFPSNFLYPHRVEPVIMGIRYSWVSWVW
jgi:predicted 2-oxoglutarate/Fe(II)-dependent dioxygenase YbiX